MYGASNIQKMKPIVLLAAAFAFAISSGSAVAQSQFAAGFSSHTVQAGGRTIYYRIGGTGSPVLLLHGYGDTGQMWSATAAVLAKNHTVIVPDLPGLGKSRPDGPAPRSFSATSRPKWAARC